MVALVTWAVTPSGGYIRKIDGGCHGTRTHSPQFHIHLRLLLYMTVSLCGRCTSTCVPLRLGEIRLGKARKEKVISLLPGDRAMRN